MSLATECFDGLLDAQEEFCGERLKATVGGVTADALVGDDRADQTLVWGGTAEAGGLEIQMKVSAFSSPLVKLCPVVVQGRNLALLSWSQSHGIYRLQCGDPTANE